VANLIFFISKNGENYPYKSQFLRVGFSFSEIFFCQVAKFRHKKEGHSD